jgi:hypothetical protein
MDLRSGLSLTTVSCGLGKNYEKITEKDVITVAWKDFGRGIRKTISISIGHQGRRWDSCLTLFQTVIRRHH